MGKKGQISFYIIIGILILLAVVVFFIVDSQEKKKPLVITAPSMVPKEVLPIKAFIEDCVDEITEQGVRTIAAQGGYLEFPEYISQNSDAYLPGDPLGIQKVPLWHYQGRSRMPELIDMEESLSKYVNDNLPACLNQYKYFENEFSIYELDHISTLVSITNQFVVVNVLLPIEITDLATDKKIVINAFNAKVDARLKRLHDYAKEVMAFENERMFLENITLDLMAMHPDFPFTNLEFTCQQKTWFVNDLAQELQITLRDIYPLLQFEDTNYLPYFEGETVYQDLADYTILDIYEGKRPAHTPDDAYAYHHFLIDASKKQYKDLNAGVQYDPAWGMRFNPHPADGGRMYGRTGRGHRNFLRFMCIQFYHFTYDVTYPVMLSVSDEISFAGQGLMFRYALPVQIIHNAPDRGDRGISFYKNYLGADAYCNADGPEVDVRVKGNYEGYDYMDVPGARISYDCFKYQCFLGETKADGGVFRLRANLPEGCANGFYVVEKDGYLEKRDQQLESTQVIDITRLQTMNVSVTKRPTDNFYQVSDMETWDTVAIHLRSEEHDYDIYAEYTHNESTMIELLDADVTYDADILLFDNLDNAIYGGYQGNVTVERSDLPGKNTIKFNVIEWLPKPFTTDDNVEMAQYLEDGEYLEALAPTFTME